MYAVMATWLLVVGVVTGASGFQDYCAGEIFQAECSASQSIRIRGAIYGRPRMGRCVTSDLGYVGCSADVSNIVAEFCTGRSQCDMRVPNSQLDAIGNPFPEDMELYLEVAYQCV